MTTPSDNNLLLPHDPMEGLQLWLEAAESAKIHEFSAMTLATVTAQFKPAARVVLFKGFSRDSNGERYPRFFTNYNSRKSRELDANKNAALVFLWTPLHRQIRIEGAVEKTSREESETYFATRARGSQIGAWASPQSQTIGSRNDLEKLFKEAEARFQSGVIPCPPNWGGWRLRPERVEFWQGVDHRLHDRIVYVKDADKKWQTSRLAP